MLPNQNMTDRTVIIIVADVKNRMVSVRGETVLLDRDVAALYGVETKHVTRAVRNNPGRFPMGYVIELSKDEQEDLRSKVWTANVSSMSRVPPKAFTEGGLYMLAAILKSELAERTTIAIVETYAQLRSMVRDMEALQALMGAELCGIHCRMFNVKDCVDEDVDMREGGQKTLWNVAQSVLLFHGSLAVVSTQFVGSATTEVLVK